MSLLLLNTDTSFTPLPVVYQEDNLTLNEARQIIYQRWLDLWVTPGGNPVTFYDNLYDTEPSLDTPWAHLVVRELDSGQATLGVTGNRKFQRQALCLVELRGPINVGMQQMDAYAQQVRDIFEGVVLAGGLTVYQTGITERGVRGGRYEVVVRSLFTYYETK